MPKVIDYVARFAFLREAAFALVSQDGLRALTRQGIADQLGVSISTVRRLLDADASLEELAASHVVTRRRRTWLAHRHDASAGRSSTLAAELLPADEWSAVTELAWWRLLVDATSSVSADVSHDTSLSLRDQFELATHGYLRPDRPPVPARRRPDPALADRVADREQEVVAQLDRVLALLAVPEVRAWRRAAHAARPRGRAHPRDLPARALHDSGTPGPRVAPGPAGPPPPAPGSRWLG